MAGESRPRKAVRSTKAGRFTEVEAADRLAFADAALGAAGHEVTDPYLNEIAARFARGEITLEEAGALSDRHVLGR